MLAVILNAHVAFYFQNILMTIWKYCRKRHSYPYGGELDLDIVQNLACCPLLDQQLITSLISKKGLSRSLLDCVALNVIDFKRSYIYDNFPERMVKTILGRKQQISNVFWKVIN